MSWQWVLREVPKTARCRFRVWLATMPLHPLPGGRPVEFRWHLKQWDGKAAEPYSWCLQETKYAAMEPGGSMDPYKPFSIRQISEHDWPMLLSTLAPEIRSVLEEQLPLWKAKAPPLPTEIPMEEGVE